jgi:hypothetical protein
MNLEQEAIIALNLALATLSRDVNRVCVNGLEDRTVNLLQEATSAVTEMIGRNLDADRKNRP